MSQATQDGNGSARRKRFVACGHRGFGQFCHRCALADSLEKHHDSSPVEHTEKERALVMIRVKALREAPKAKTAPFNSAELRPQ